MKPFRFWIVTGTVFLGLAELATAQERPEPRFANLPSITVMGVAEETWDPDVVSVLLHATADASTADESLQSLSKKVKTLTDVVRDEGFHDSDTRSTGPTTEVLYKRFYDQGGHELFEKRQPIGYRAHFNLTLKSRLLDKIGTLLPKVTAADCLVDSITFAVSNEREIRNNLEEQAITNAVARAKRQIAAAGAKPGKILQIGGNNGPYADGQADLNMPMHKEPYTRDFTFALHPGKQEIIVERQVVMEILPE